MLKFGQTGMRGSERGRWPQADTTGWHAFAGSRAFAAAMPTTYSHAVQTEEDCPLATQTSSKRHGVGAPGAIARVDPMKRVAIWAFYAVGALAIGYLALYAYAIFSGRDLLPGDPIHIFRKPDAPEYS